MPVDGSPPGLRIAERLVDDAGWQVTDMLARADDAVLVEFRRAHLRQTVIIVARDGEWVRPGVVAMNAREVPEQRRPVTLPHEPLQHGGTRASAWPAPDGEMPDAVWMTVDGYAAADVERVRVSTALDRHEATARPDGSFLTLLRATPREKPRLRLRLTTGGDLDVSL